MKIGLVGATGVLGRALVPLLLERGYSVRALARFANGKKSLFPREVECLTCDLLADDVSRSLPSLLTGCEAVIHAATAIPPDREAPGAWDANTKLRTEGTRRLLEGSLSAGVQLYVQQSIVMAYPDMGDRWIAEDTPLDTSPDRSGLCAPVIAMEEMVKAISPRQMRWCVLRGGAFVGPGTFQDVTIQRMLAGQEIVPGDGQNFISFVRVNDMASAVVAALQYAPNSSIFNINADPIRQGEYSDTLAALVGAPKPARDEHGHRPPSYRCSNQSAMTMLGWTPQSATYPSEYTQAHHGEPKAEPRF